MRMSRRNTAGASTALRPSGADQLIKDGHQVMVETGAGAGTSFTDEQYREKGCSIGADAA